LSLQKDRKADSVVSLDYAPRINRAIDPIGRHLAGPLRLGEVCQAACERVLPWASHRGMAEGQWLGDMWDEPETVVMADCRCDVALVVDDVKPAGEIGRFEFPPMRVAEVVISGSIALEARAFDWLCKTWLPHSAYVPDDQPAFEAWVGRPFAHGNRHFEIACQLPVRPA
jgi:AraC family transcriptional regulator